ncbi:MAG: hypothetical protein NTV23_05530 [Propionibacteriales bacterium]|nr:hypothetical protein [Propionibacteriales bacterium]
MNVRRGPGTARLVPLVLVVVLTLVGGLLAGCADGDEQGLLGGGTGSGAVTLAEAQQLLDTRAAAVRDGDRAAFLGTLVRNDTALVKRQRRLFANLQDLPLATFSYTVLPATWPTPLLSPDWGSEVSLPQVRVTTQLDGFDAVPVNRITGFAFVRVDGAPRIVSELTGSGEQFPGSGPAPWDLVRVRVRTEGGTLQLFDNDTWASREQVASVVRRGVVDVQQGLPFDWDGHAVVYVFSRQVVLDSFEGVPGGNITHLGAMTFPVYADPGQPTVAGTRFTLLPSSIRAGQPFLDRITRHELTHVAVGDRDDGAPVWFAEGLAEYMGARSIRKFNRKIATVAVSRARDGVRALPRSATFNGDNQAWHYALSWMACDYIAATQGEPRLWELMEAFHNSGAGTPDELQDGVLLTVLGIDGRELAEAAGRRILDIYDKAGSLTESPVVPPVEPAPSLASPATSGSTASAM